MTKNCCWLVAPVVNWKLPLPSKTLVPRMVQLESGDNATLVELSTRYENPAVPLVPPMTTLPPDWTILLTPGRGRERIFKIPPAAPGVFRALVSHRSPRPGCVGTMLAKAPE